MYIKRETVKETKCAEYSNLCVDVLYIALVWSLFFGVDGKRIFPHLMCVIYAGYNFYRTKWAGATGISSRYDMQ